MTKTPHLKSIAVLVVLALVAVGVRRWKTAWAMAVLVGFGWELAETTVVGHSARLADLAPDVVSASGTALLAAVVSHSLQRRAALWAYERLDDPLATEPMTQRVDHPAGRSRDSGAK
jgi:hypothetical protein